jgi:fucose 4-O-acetylase-like acetyltransferase
LSELLIEPLAPPRQAAPAPLEAAPVPRPTGRLAFMDAARGIAILLVVLGHVFRGLIDAKLKGADVLGTPTYFIYTFHIPLFFLCSGLFAERAAARAAKDFLSSLGIRLLWPYALWYCVQVAAITMAGSLVNHAIPPSSDSYLQVLWSPGGQFWFLYCLLFMQLGAYILLRIGGRAAVLVGALMALSLNSLFALPPVWSQFCANTIFFALGIAAGGAAEARALLMRWGRPTLAAPILAVGWFGFASAMFLRHAGYAGVADIAAGVLGAGAVLTISSWRRIERSAVLGYLGRHSLSIYLLHVLFVAGARIFASKLLHVDSAVLFAPLLLACGVAGPCVVFELSRRLRVTRALGLA